MSDRGRDGRDGRHGRDGQDGLDGLTAYQIAVAKGYVGDESAWLEALRGPPGIDGKDGESVAPDVVEALVAKQVAEIPRPLDGAKGEKGDTGEQGIPGLDGKDGKDAKPAPRVSWRADFDRDEQTKQTLQITVTPHEGSGLGSWLILPVRNEGVLEYADLIPV